MDAPENRHDGTLGALERMAGIADRNAFWMQFSHLRGTVKVGRLHRDAAFEAGVAELRRRVHANREAA